jgi:hypothetical protein
MCPLVVIGAAVGIGLAASAAAAQSGKSGFRATNWKQLEGGGYDARAYEYGGGLQGRARGQYDRSGRAVDFMGEGQARAAQSMNQSRAMNLHSRSEQQNALQGLRSAAENKTQTVAEQVGARQMDRTMAGLGAAAASTRGGASAMALAQRQAMQSSSEATGDITSRTQEAAALEVERARSAYMQGTGALRAGDANLYGQDITSREGYDRSTLAHMGMQHGIANDERMARMQQQNMESGWHQNAEKINAGINSDNAKQDMEYWKMGSSAVSGAMGAGGAGGK